MVKGCRRHLDASRFGLGGTARPTRSGAAQPRIWVSHLSISVPKPAASCKDIASRRLEPRCFLQALRCPPPRRGYDGAPAPCSGLVCCYAGGIHTVACLRTELPSSDTATLGCAAVCAVEATQPRGFACVRRRDSTVNWPNGFGTGLCPRCCMQ